MGQAQREPQFAEVTPVKAEARDSRIAMRIQTGGIVAELHNGADPVTHGGTENGTTKSQ